MNKRFLTAAVLIALTAMLTACSGNKLKGSVRNNRYTAPGGAFSVALTKPGPPEDVVEDEVRGNTIMVRQRELYGGVNRVEAQKLTPAELERIRKVGVREALPAHFDEAVLPMLQQATGNRGEVIERRAVSGGDAYYVAVRFRELGEPDPSGQPKDHFRGYVLQVREPYLFLVSRSRNIAASLWTPQAATELYTQTVGYARGIEINR
jgi:hypothetical protein